MSDFGPRLYGDPCRECGFSWAIPIEEGRRIVVAAPDEYVRLLANGSGQEQHPDLGWNVVAYVCHVGDNLRIWAERLAGAAAGGDPRVSPYDNDLLAVARNYGGVPVQGALWSLRQAVSEWRTAVVHAEVACIVLLQPDRGEQSVLDVVRSNSHDVFHHRWDIMRSLS